MHATTQKLIADIEAKDRRFRTAQAIFMVLIMLAISALLMFQYIQLSDANDTQDAQTKSVLAIEKHNDEQLQKQTRYIQCIAQFFARNDRATLVLKDLDQCNIQSDGITVPGVDLTPTQAISTTNPQLSTGNPAGAGSIQPPVVVTPLPTPPSSEPVQILGISVCIPFTHLCISR